MKSLIKIAAYSLLLLSLLLIFSCADNVNNRKLVGDWEVISKRGFSAMRSYYSFKKDGTGQIIYGFRERKPGTVPITDFDLDDRDNLTMKMKTSAGKTVETEYPVKFLSPNLMLLSKKQGSILLSRIYLKIEDDDLAGISIKYNSKDYHVKVNVYENQAPKLIRDDHKIENELVGLHFADIEEADPPLFEGIKRLLGAEFERFRATFEVHNRFRIDDDFVFISSYPKIIENFLEPGEAVLIINLYDYSLSAGISDPGSSDITVFCEKKIPGAMSLWVWHQKGELLKHAVSGRVERLE